MPTFPTPAPIDLAINLPVGAIQVLATDRADTVVSVTPTNPNRAVDRRGAEETTVDLDGRRLTVMGPRPRLSWIGPTESVDVTVEVPTGSRLTVEISVGGVRTVGRLGATRIKNATGGVEVDGTGDLWVRAGHGSVTAETADGGVEITADHGRIRLGTVTGDSVLKASHGTVQVEESGGDLEAKLSYGDLDIGRALGSITAKTAYGAIQVGEVSSGSVQLESGYGQVTVGVRPGVPAWLDLSSKDGHVRNHLDGDRAPGESEQTVVVRARTRSGDITVQRAR
ncbi:DUF4097 family beta strand repeat-containing protein [uncultured Cellulomonas sp.]|uniref:DUF4097 family beta strand repeat-containing protein n=1 Tax=uncultured Cellulomonas sp. TaxID=189682 RepID=UPI0028E24D6B|nr:DUF4097 family beta strand repeat-containing protein [uncultured Cellulomonas sp.]